MRRMQLWHVEVVHAWHWNTPRDCGCSNFEAIGKFKENLTVGSELVVPWKKFAPAVSFILGTILEAVLLESSNPCIKG